MGSYGFSPLTCLIWAPPLVKSTGKKTLRIRGCGLCACVSFLRFDALYICMCHLYPSCRNTFHGTADKVLDKRMAQGDDGKKCLEFLIKFKGLSYRNAR